MPSNASLRSLKFLIPSKSTERGCVACAWVAWVAKEVRLAADSNQGQPYATPDIDCLDIVEVPELLVCTISDTQGRWLVDVVMNGRRDGWKLCRCCARRALWISMNTTSRTFSSVMSSLDGWVQSLECAAVLVPVLAGTDADSHVRSK